ncbi:helix-turn-helix domain-containing protein [Pelotomaculum terephthalicicum JT]|uniref:helix-turn-helix domain-containing protein n=1 Tax=Pelotomaculum TaxID=191373 RepID=UPI0009CEEAEA|nr:MULTISPECIES: helix-turn-helix transcriptional regulator [Pelotomaculum]MCG9967295.1 helix-turn-helix domain-containing protein [Pelotomaculum terephthalicicum JT]OPX86889.1 MAG: HTH-type transcriptional repressor RghR [Pelotomaculum sp. PtaB.Bin117]
MSMLGKYIADQRTTKNLSMRKLANLAKISHTEIHRLEAGERKNPSPFVLKSIAHALDLNFEDIMEAAGYTDNFLSASVSPVSLPGIEELDEKELEEVRDFIDFLRSKKRLKNIT